MTNNQDRNSEWWATGMSPNMYETMSEVSQHFQGDAGLGANLAF